MVSAKNVKSVQAAFDGWRRGGIDGTLEFLQPDIEWIVRADLPDAGTYRGHDQVRQLLGRFEEVLGDLWIEPQEFIEAGEDLVIVPLHWGGRGRASGVEIAERQGETWVFTIRDGKAARVREFRHTEDALKAVGSSE